MQFKRTGAPKERRTYNKHGEEVKLAADIAGCTVWNVYAVLRGRHRSKRVTLALEKARRQLKAAEERVA